MSENQPVGGPHSSGPHSSEAQQPNPWKWFAEGVTLVLFVTVSLAVRVALHEPSNPAVLQATVCLVLAVICFTRWWRNVPHPIIPPASKRAFAQWWTWGGVALFGLGAVLGSANSGGKQAVPAGFMVAGVVAVFGFWGAVFAIRFSSAIGDEFAVATTPVPSPGEIANALEAEWGRPPTVVEVAAVHQMLTSRKNEALLTTGLSLGALYLMDRNLHGGK